MKGKSLSVEIVMVKVFLLLIFVENLIRVLFAQQVSTSMNEGIIRPRLSKLVIFPGFAQIMKFVLEISPVDSTFTFMRHVSLDFSVRNALHT